MKESFPDQFDDVSTSEMHNSGAEMRSVRVSEEVPSDAEVQMLLESLGVSERTSDVLAQEEESLVDALAA